MSSRCVRVCAVVIGVVSFSTNICLSQDLVGCGRALNPQPAGTRDAKGQPDIVVSAERNGKKGVYFYSGDRPVFLALSSEEIKAGSFTLSFKHPISGRSVTISGKQYDAKNPAILYMGRAADSGRTVEAPDLAFDASAVSSLDGYLASFIKLNAYTLPRSAGTMGLAAPESLRQWIDFAGRFDVKTKPEVFNQGLDNPKVAEIFSKALTAYAQQGKKPEFARALAANMTSIYKAAAPNYIDINTLAIAAYIRLLDNHCQLAELKTLAAKTQLEVALAQSQLRVDGGVNDRLIKPKIADEVEKGLPEVFTKLIESGEISPNVYKAKVAEHFTGKVDFLRKEAQKTLDRAITTGKTMAASPTTH